METSKEKKEEFLKKVENLRNDCASAIISRKYPDSVVMAAMWSLMGELIFLRMTHSNAEEVYQKNVTSMNMLKEHMDEIIKEQSNQQDNGN